MIIPTIRRPDPGVISAYRALQAAHDSVTCALSDCMGRFGAMSVELRPLSAPVRFAGSAVTVKTLASDLAAPFKAIDIAEPGDVIVIDAHTSASTAFWGENMTISAMNRGVVAAVIDGACRDVTEIRHLGFPVVCRGIVPNVAAVTGYGEVNVTVQCGGVSVSPGDLLVADENGVVVVPLERCEAVLAQAQQLLATERLLQDKLRAGATIGQLVDVDAVFANTFAYQVRATGQD